MYTKWLILSRKMALECPNIRCQTSIFNCIFISKRQTINSKPFRFSIFFVRLSTANCKCSVEKSYMDFRLDSVRLSPIESGLVDYVSYSFMLVRKIFISVPRNENTNSTTKTHRRACDFYVKWQHELLFWGKKSFYFP